MQTSVVRRFLFVSALVSGFLIVAACSTTPYMPGRSAADETMLVVPLEIVREVGGEIPYVFSLNYDGVADSKTGDLLNFTQQYAFIRGVKPGSHRVTLILARWKATNQIVHQFDMDIPFTLAAGELTILPARFSVAIKANGFFLSTYNLLIQQMLEIQNNLQKYQNIATWSLAPLALK